MKHRHSAVRLGSTIRHLEQDLICLSIYLHTTTLEIQDKMRSLFNREVTISRAKVFGPIVFRSSPNTVASGSFPMHEFLKFLSPGGYSSSDFTSNFKLNCPNTMAASLIS